MNKITRLFVAILALGALWCVGPNGARAESLDTLYSFCQKVSALNICIDGATPSSRLLQLDGAYYGTTAQGGPTGHGTLYRVTSAGTFRSIYSFCAQKYCPDGDVPGNYLTRDAVGNIFGVTYRGGTGNGGTVFEWTSSGRLRTLYLFCSVAGCTDGITPVAVTLDSAGDLYGTTGDGGANGAGTVFKIDKDGAFHTLYSFCSAKNCSDGIGPGALLLAKNGKFYGVTSAGGANQAGTVFSMTPAGAVVTLYSLCVAKNCPDGAEPNATLVEGLDGAFYGTTMRGGLNGDGTVFRVTTGGKWTRLYSFCSLAYCDDGFTPLDGLSRAKDGSFYGAASGGGIYFNGLIFHVTPAGSYSVSYNFCASHGCFDGSTPAAAPLVGTNGLLYGSTTAGGDRVSSGSVYQLTP
jgi:uncharacterized repeat protein (TIGR03803 family)